jgi:hypothetical protein
MGGNTELLIVAFTIMYCWYNNMKMKEYMDKKVLLLEDHAELARYLYPQKDEENANILPKPVSGIYTTSDEAYKNRPGSGTDLIPPSTIRPSL